MIGYLADFLFPRERAQSPVKLLSGGERNRLLLARLFARPANVLVLDEPTNDLDIETLELLEELIGGFDGTVLLVSHDRVVPRQHRDQHARVRRRRRRDRVRRRLRGLLATARKSGFGIGDSGLDACRAALPTPPRPRALVPEALGAGATNAAERTTAKPGKATADDRRLRRSYRTWFAPKPAKLSFKEKKELESLPAHIEALEAEQARLQNEVRIDRVLQGERRAHQGRPREDRAIGQELEIVLARWVELDERSR